MARKDAKQAKAWIDEFKPKFVTQETFANAYLAYLDNHEYMIETKEGHFLDALIYDKKQLMIPDHGGLSKVSIAAYMLSNRVALITSIRVPRSSGSTGV